MSATRTRIISRLQAQLAKIAPGRVLSLPDGAYTCTSTVNTVAPWRSSSFSTADLPAIVWRDRIETVKDIYTAATERRSVHIVIGLFFSGALSTSGVRDLLSDVLAALGSDGAFRGLAHYTEVANSVLLERQAGPVTAAAQINLNVVYTPVLDIFTDSNRLIDEQGNVLTDDNGDVLTW